MNTKKKVLLGMSGGVDSSVSALLLKNAGYDVIGVYMKNWDCAPEDYNDVVSICEKLDIPYYGLSFKDEYYDKVFKTYLDYLDKGYNINPDVLCNKYIKFDLLYNTAMKLGCDYFATGHYAKIKDNKLCRPKDSSKDQTYFLYDIDYNILNKVILPLGDLLKTEVRKIAIDNNFINKDKKDSTGICFIGNNNFKNFISKYKEEKIGDIVFNDTVLGKHKGLHFYTIGQRKGLGLSGGPFIVVNKDVSSNTLIVDKKDSESTKSRIFVIDNKLSDFNGNALFRFSNLGSLHKGVIKDNKITLDKKIDKVGLGQSIVFYDKDGIVLGGGTLTRFK